MPLLHDQALLLRRVAYGDADEVATLLTRGHGKIQVMAKNSRNSRRRFPGGLQAFVKVEAAFRAHPNSLSFLESAQPLRAWPGLLASVERIALGWTLLEVADLLKHPGESHPEYFDALEAGLESLAEGASPRESALRAEASLLSLAGWAPRLDACVSCRRAWPFARPRLSPGEGGLLCSACGQGGRELGPREAEGLCRLFSREPGPVALAEGALMEFLQYQLGKGLKTLGFERLLGAAL